MNQRVIITNEGYVVTMKNSDIINLGLGASVRHKPRSKRTNVKFIKCLLSSSPIKVA